MKQFPQDAGSGLSEQSDRDYGDAAHFGALAHVGPEGIVTGCSLSADFTVPDVTVSGGVVRIIATDLDSRAHEAGVTTWPEAVQCYRVAQTTLALTDGAVNELYVVGDQSSPDNADVTAISDGSTPAAPFLKIGEVDTANDTVSSQWQLIAGDGTLTYPSESAADAASGSLPEGTVVYDRAGNSHFYVT